MIRFVSRMAAGVAARGVRNAFVRAGAPYPTKPIRIVVPFPAGGTTDILARAVAQKLTETLGQHGRRRQPRRARAATSAPSSSPSAPPDGYTLLMGTVGTHAINASLYAKMPYDPSRTSRR